MSYTQFHQSLISPLTVISTAEQINIQRTQTINILLHYIWQIDKMDSRSPPNLILFLYCFWYSKPQCPNHGIFLLHSTYFTVKWLNSAKRIWNTHQKQCKTASLPSVEKEIQFINRVESIFKTTSNELQRQQSLNQTTYPWHQHQLSKKSHCPRVIYFTVSLKKC